MKNVQCLREWVLVNVNMRFVVDDQPIDPYVSIDADEHHLDRSTTKPKTFDPVWNETFIHQVQNVSRYLYNCIFTYYSEHIILLMLHIGKYLCMKLFLCALFLY